MTGVAEVTVYRSPPPPCEKSAAQTRQEKQIRVRIREEVKEGENRDSVQIRKEKKSKENRTLTLDPHFGWTSEKEKKEMGFGLDPLRSEGEEEKEP